MTTDDLLGSPAGQLRLLTTCRCEAAYTDRQLHDPRCCHAEHREDVEALVAERDAARKALGEASSYIAALKAANDEQAKQLHQLLNPTGGNLTVTLGPGAVLVNSQEAG